MAALAGSKCFFW